MGYLVCDKCGGYYELKPGESIDDFQNCSCGGKLEFVENTNDKKCLNCGIYNSNNAVFCKNCGKNFNLESVSDRGADKMVDELFCSNCGKKNSSDSKYCNYCGSNLTKSTLDKNKTEKNDTNKSEHRNTVILGYILSFFFVPVGLVMGMYLISQKSEYAKRNGWMIFGIAFTISFLIIVLVLFSIESQLGSIRYDLGDIYYRMGEMHLY